MLFAILLIIVFLFKKHILLIMIAINNIWMSDHLMDTLYTLTCLILTTMLWSIGYYLYFKGKEIKVQRN